MTRTAVVLFGHGTVENLDDLPPFVTNIRRGHPPPPELLAELRHRYEVIGGRSPYNDIARRLASRVGDALGVPAAVAMRLWHPFAKDVLRVLAKERDIERAIFVPLAQHSGDVYAEAARKAAQDLAGEGIVVSVAPTGNWGQTPELLDAFAANVRAALLELPEPLRARTTTLFTAHSLPKAIIDAGDRYEAEFRASVAGVVARLAGTGLQESVAFQSQGPAVGAGGRPVAWLGPDLPAALDAVAARGHTHVLFAPIGFLADHVEILYDLDVEAKGLAAARGLTMSRAPSLNDDEALVAVIAALARPLVYASEP